MRTVTFAAIVIAICAATATAEKPKTVRISLVIRLRQTCKELSSLSHLGSSLALIQCLRHFSGLAGVQQVWSCRRIAPVALSPFLAYTPGMADRYVRFLNELPAQDQANVVLTGCFKYVQLMLSSCTARFKMYRDSNENSGHVVKLLGEINMLIGVLLLARLI